MLLFLTMINFHSAELLIKKNQNKHASLHPSRTFYMYFSRSYYTDPISQSLPLVDNCLFVKIFVDVAESSLINWFSGFLVA